MTTLEQELAPRLGQVEGETSVLPVHKTVSKKRKKGRNQDAPFEPHKKKKRKHREAFSSIDNSQASLQAIFGARSNPSRHARPGKMIDWADFANRTSNNSDYSSEDEDEVAEQNDDRDASKSCGAMENEEMKRAISIVGKLPMPDRRGMSGGNSLSNINAQACSRNPSQRALQEESDAIDKAHACLRTPAEVFGNLASLEASQLRSKRPMYVLWRRPIPCTRFNAYRDSNTQPRMSEETTDSDDEISASLDDCSRTTVSRRRCKEESQVSSYYREDSIDVVPWNSPNDLASAEKRLSKDRSRITVVKRPVRHFVDLSTSDAESEEDNDTVRGQHSEGYRTPPLSDAPIAELARVRPMSLTPSDADTEISTPGTDTSVSATLEVGVSATSEGVSALRHLRARRPTVRPVRPMFPGSSLPPSQGKSLEERNASEWDEIANLLAQRFEETLCLFNRYAKGGNSLQEAIAIDDSDDDD